MDICRTFLCVGFALLIWNFQFRGIRPVRDFVLWGFSYAFHFMLMSVLILIIWGVIGEGFGLQGMFLENDAPTQILLGSTVMLLFSSLILHYSVLDSPGGWWNNSLKTLIGVIRNLNGLMPPEYPVQLVLRNGFLEKLEPREIEIIYDLAYGGGPTESLTEPGSQGFGSKLIEMLRAEPFRLLVSPAILLIKGLMLVFLVGVVPSVVVPLFAHDSVMFRERLPWLVGVVLGDLLGIYLACVTTRWAAQAAGWQLFEDELLESLRAFTDPTISPAARRQLNSLSVGDIGSNDALADRDRLGTASRMSGESTPRWFSFVFAFFVIHFVVNIVLPENLSNRWIDWPERTYIDVQGDINSSHGSADRWSGLPWLPVVILLAEVLGAVALLYIPSIMHRIWGPSGVSTTIDRVSLSAKAVTRLVLRTLSTRPARWVLCGSLVVLVILSVAIARMTSLLPARSLWDGLSTALLLGAFFAYWLFGFRLATLSGSREPGRHLWKIQGAILVLLVLLYLAGTARWLVVFLATIIVVFQVLRLLGNPTCNGRGRSAPLWVLVLISVAAMVGTLLIGRLVNEVEFSAAFWLSLAILVVGASALHGIAIHRATMLYPLTLILAFMAFAIPYNALDESWQSAMPAAGSFACMVGLLAAAYTLIAFIWPKVTFGAAVVVAASIFVLNGNAWFVAPNQFKTTFPNMQEYYALPVYLNSRDYFRGTTPSAVRLRDRDVTDISDRKEKQGPSERLATAYFQMLGQRRELNGGHVVQISVEDPRGRLRAGVGDKMQLVSEEWFTTLPEGDDCIVLAEEPFFRKIYRWFRYEKLQIVSGGIVKGRSYPMRPLEDAVQIPRLDADFGPVYYEPVEGPGERLGFRLRKLAAAYRKADAQYVLISMYWSGRVATVTHTSHLDTYVVEFEIPQGHQPLDPAQEKTMNTWMQRCHLDVVRPVKRVDRNIEREPSKASPPEVSEAGTGDCLVLEEVRDEAPVPVAVFMTSVNDTETFSPSFVPYWPTRENLSRYMESTPSPDANPPNLNSPGTGPVYTLRPANDRGIFASPLRGFEASLSELEDGTRRLLRIALYNSGRVRPGDRLMLSWNGQGRSHERKEPQHGGIFEIQELDAQEDSRGDSETLPPGYHWVTLLPISASGTLRSTPPSISGKEGHDLLVGEWQLLQLLNNTEVLLSWKRLVGGLWSEKKPKLVIIAVSGGGIRASVWTSVVLRKLERTLGAEFPYHIRLITGASGGMVGGSYYATSVRPPTPHILQGGQADFLAVHGISAAQFVDRMAANQLDAVAGRMVFADLISPLNPFLQKGDRGKTLEKTWVRGTGGEFRSPMARPLQSYAIDERLGWRPSMVYTPMMVEDGRRILISNLDLAFATRNVAGLLLEPSSRMIDRPAFQGDDLDRSIHDEDEVLSLSSVEFYRLFPESHDFRVTTAARMSASFPWVSPAISLPTSPPRRVVDAGYYDNYGVNLAALWLSKMRSWLEANTSGVVVVQIRDHVSQGARTEIDFDRLTVSSALDRLTWHAGSELISPGFQGISTPLLGISNARQWTMSFRNDEQIDLLDLLFDGENTRDFFRTVVFECPVEVSLNWQLSTREKEILASGFGQENADPRQELDGIKDYLVGKDSYEFHKWMVDHLDDPNFEAEQKAKYAEQLHKLGILDTDRLSLRQCRQFYGNIITNLKRLELLRDWWRDGHEKIPDEAAQPGGG